MVRAGYRALREPAALAMIWGYAGAVARRRPRCMDDEASAHLRNRQRARALGSRAREALGR